MEQKQKRMQFLENMIRRIVKEEVNISEKIDLNQPFWVIEKGGSIGGSKSNYIPGKGRVIATTNSKEEAVEYAKRRRSGLSKGERSYYGMGYSVVEASDSLRKLLQK